MRIGPESWHCKSIDSMGVPSSGIYAGAEEFAAEIAEEDWKLAWNPFWGFFVMYQVVGREIIPHYQFFNWQRHEPIALRMEWISIFRSIRRNNRDAATIEVALEEAKRAEKQRLVKEYYEQAQAMKGDIGTLTLQQMGLLTPKTTVQMPGEPQIAMVS